MKIKKIFLAIKRFVLNILIKARKVTLPGFDRIPLSDVMLLFFRSLTTIDNSLSIRAAAVAFSMFMALFPALIFLFTLIPYIPIENFQEQLLGLVESVIPSSIYNVVRNTITEVVTQPHGDLLSFSFIVGMFISTSGLITMMIAFDASNLIDNNKRSWVKQRLTATLLMLTLSILLSFAISLIAIGQRIINYINDIHAVSQYSYYLLSTGRWIVIIMLIFFIFSFLFYFGPSVKTKFRFISPGSILSTGLSIMLLGGFHFYINNFNRYNILYGSIGTLLVIMLLLYLISFILLFGFELNASIEKAKSEGKRRIAKQIKPNSTKDSLPIKKNLHTNIF